MSLLSNLSQRSDMMDQMMHRTGAADAVLGHLDMVGQYRAMTLRCFGCSHGEECHAWLETAKDGDQAPAFCRNRETFDQLAHHP